MQLKCTSEKQTFHHRIRPAAGPAGPPATTPQKSDWDGLQRSTTGDRRPPTKKVAKKHTEQLRYTRRNIRVILNLWRFEIGKKGLGISVILWLELLKI